MKISCFIVALALMVVSLCSCGLLKNQSSDQSATQNQTSVSSYSSNTVSAPKTESEQKAALEKKCEFTLPKSAAVEKFYFSVDDAYPNNQVGSYSAKIMIPDKDFSAFQTSLKEHQHMKTDKIDVINPYKGDVDEKDMQLYYWKPFSINFTLPGDTSYDSNETQGNVYLSITKNMDGKRYIYLWCHTTIE